MTCDATRYCAVAAAVRVQAQGVAALPGLARGTVSATGRTNDSEFGNDEDDRNNECGPTAATCSTVVPESSAADDVVLLAPRETSTVTCDPTGSLGTAVSMTCVGVLIKYD